MKVTPRSHFLYVETNETINECRCTHPLHHDGWVKLSWVPTELPIKIHQLRVSQQVDEDPFTV